MPTYEYRCDDCGRSFTAVEHMDEHGRTEPSCPDCQSHNVRQLFGSFFAKTDKKS